MKIKWKLQDRYRSGGETRTSFSGLLRYGSIHFSELFRQQIRELRKKGFAIRLRSVVLWRTQIGHENYYYVFTKLKLRRNDLILQTALRSDSCSSLEIAVMSASIAPGTLRSAEDPIQTDFNQKERIERRALTIASAGSDVDSYWHQVEIAYNSWHDGSLVAVQALSESKMRLVVRQYEGGELAELQSIYGWGPHWDLGATHGTFAENQSALIAASM